MTAVAFLTELLRSRWCRAGCAAEIVWSRPPRST